jgi:hypothetical protein
MENDFLLIYQASYFLGKWSFSIHQSLDDLISAVNVDGRTESSSITVVHIGFSRPELKVFQAIGESIGSSWNGKVLFSSGAKYTMPNRYPSLSIAVPGSSQFPLYLATSEWGYDSDGEIDTLSLPVARNFESWVKNFVAEFPHHEEILGKKGIFDDADYLERENELSRELRVALGGFRFNALVKDRRNPGNVAECAPAWLQSYELARFNLRGRLISTFPEMGLKYVRDLIGFTASDFTSRYSFGEGSLTQLLRLLTGPIENPPNLLDPVPLSVTEAELVNVVNELILDDQNLLEAVRSSVARLTNHNQRLGTIIGLRMGLNSPSQTLDLIGQQFDLSRERIRQLERPALQFVQHDVTWPNVFVGKIQMLMMLRERPLAVSSLEGIDSWFEGVSECPSLISYLIKKLRTGFFTKKIGSVEYLSRLPSGRWSQMFTGIRRKLDTLNLQGQTKEQCENEILIFIPLEIREFKHIIYEIIFKECNFTEEVVPRFLSRKLDVKTLVTSVLLDSEGPLHVKEITKMTTKLSNQPQVELTIRNVCFDNAILFGPSTFGLEKHILLSDKDMQYISDEIEQVVINFPESRNWHTHELAEILRGEHVSPIFLNPYNIAIALKKKSTGLVSVGKMKWVRSNPDGLLQRPIQMFDAFISILNDVGGPLMASEILLKLNDEVGFGANRLPPIQHPLVRLPDGRWGLNGRDTAISLADQGILLEILKSRLAEMNRGLHISEFPGALDLWMQFSAEDVYAVAILDEAISIDINRYMYLTEWGGSRRISVADAVRSVLIESHEPLILTKLHELTREKLEMDCPKNRISSALQSIGAVYSDDNLWSLPDMDDAVIPEISPPKVTGGA